MKKIIVLLSISFCFFGHLSAKNLDFVGIEYPQPFVYKFSKLEFEKALNVIANFEVSTSGWGGVTGNFDDQGISAGVLQWNFVQKSIYPLLDAFIQKHGIEKGRLLMGESWDVLAQNGCLNTTLSRFNLALHNNCITYLKSVQPKKELPDLLRNDFSRFMNSPEMRQIQVTNALKTMHNALNLTKNLGKLYNNHGNFEFWEVVLFMNVKTQLGSFSKSSIVSVDNIIAKAKKRQRKPTLTPIEWNKCQVKLDDITNFKDVSENIKIWDQKLANIDDKREKLLLHSYVRAKVASGGNGKYQSDVFTRLATIIFGKGYVHGKCYDFEKSDFSCSN